MARGKNSSCKATPENPKYLGANLKEKDGDFMKMEILKKARKIKVENYIGLWSVIDDLNGYVLLEHNTYGDETCYLVAKANDFTLKDFIKKSTEEKVKIPFLPETATIFETYDGIEICLEDEGII